MSQRDTFIDEVTEEVRRDRLFRLWRRYGPYAISVIVALVAAFAAWEWWQALENRRSQASMAAFLEILESGENSARDLEAWAASAPAGYAVLARMTAAALHAEKDDSASAGQLYAEIADDQTVDLRLRELARLKSVMAASESLSPEELAVRLRPLALEGMPFRDVAREILAGALLDGGDVAGAREILDALEEEGRLTVDATSRLRAMKEFADILESDGS